MKWIWEREDNIRRLTEEFNQQSIILTTYLTLYGKSIAKRDKDRITDKLYHILINELPYSPYHLDN